jgi:hypothetical protein
MTQDERQDDSGHARDSEPVAGGSRKTYAEYLAANRAKKAYRKAHHLCVEDGEPLTVDDVIAGHTRCELHRAKHKRYEHRRKDRYRNTAGACNTCGDPIWQGDPVEAYMSARSVRCLRCPFTDWGGTAASEIGGTREERAWELRQVFLRMTGLCGITGTPMVINGSPYAWNSAQLEHRFPRNSPERTRTIADYWFACRTGNSLKNSLHLPELVRFCERTYVTLTSPKHAELISTLHAGLEPGTWPKHTIGGVVDAITPDHGGTHPDQPCVTA